MTCGQSVRPDERLESAFIFGKTGTYCLVYLLLPPCLRFKKTVILPLPLNRRCPAGWETAGQIPRSTGMYATHFSWRVENEQSVCEILRSGGDLHGAGGSVVRWHDLQEGREDLLSGRGQVRLPDELRRLLRIRVPDYQRLHQEVVLRRARERLELLLS